MDAKTVNIAEFKSALKSGIVEFIYVKKNGDKRKAVGTMKAALLEAVTPKKSKSNDDKPKKKLPETSIFYYDCEKKAYRSFIAENLLSYNVISAV